MDFENISYLQQPLQLVSELRGDRLVTLSWKSFDADKLDFKISYQVQIKKNNERQWHDRNEHKDKTQNKICFENLEYDTLYSCRVRACGGSFISRWSEELFISTNKLQEPKDVSISFADTAETTLYWNEDYEVTEKRLYELSYTLGSNNTTRFMNIENVSKDKHGFCIVKFQLDLENKMDYEYKLMISTEYGDSEWSMKASRNNEQDDLFIEDISTSIKDDVTYEDIMWTISHANTIVESETHETLAPDRKTAVLRLLQSIIMMDYTSINQLIKWKDEKGEQTGHYHPMDLIHTVILKSSAANRQKLFKKLAFCKLAVPVLSVSGFEEFKDEALFFDTSLHHIPVSWIEKTGHLVEGNAINANITVVSMLRMGEISLSKSSIGNDILGFKKHALKGSCGFFNKNAMSSMRVRVKSEGNVEALWYEQIGKPADFSESFTLLNLRGDALSHADTASVMVANSDVVIMFVEENMFTKINYRGVLQQIAREVKTESNPRLIVVITEITKDRFKSQQRLFRDISSNLGCKIVEPESKELLPFLRKEIQDYLNTERSPKPLMDRFSVEEGIELESKQIPYASESNDTASTMLRDLVAIGDKTNEGGRNEARKDLLPLQSKVKAYADAQRKSNRSPDIEIRKQKSNEMIAIREEQFKLVNNDFPSFIKKFATFLLEQVVDSACSAYVKNIQNSLDEWCKQRLTQLRQQYTVAVNAYQKCKEEDDKKRKEAEYGKLEESEETKVASKECKNLMHTIISMSVGIENVLREIAQIYEIIASQPDNDNRTAQLKLSHSKFPEMAARFLLDGIAIEIMDGDGLSSPVDWLRAVLTNANTMLKQKLNIAKDPRIAVITVLGTQSTGKSTLLNTMFGMQFPVSAGRCTRGAFMQLIPVEIKDWPYDALIVIDTEGLAAPEFRDSETHDNEIATFVIGISDLTIINVFGELPTGIENFLQISTCALMRMNLVNFQPHCVFVHQQCDSTAFDKNLTNRQFFLQQMDETVKLQAKSMGQESRFQSFKDILDLSLEQDFFYFPSLLEGSPPMSPPDFWYSQAACRLRDYILKVLEEKNDAVTIPEFSTKLGEIWFRVLQENYVLSLRHKAELEVRHEIEQKRSEWKLYIFSKMNGEVEKYRKMMQAYASSHREDKDFISALGERYGKYVDNITDCAHKELEFEENRFHAFINSRIIHKVIFKDWEERTISFMREYLERTLREARSRLQKCHNYNKEEQAWQDEISKACSSLYEEARTLALSMLLTREQTQNHGSEFSQDEIDVEFKLFWERITNNVVKESSLDRYKVENINRKFLGSLLDQFEYQNGFNRVNENFADLNKPIDIRWVKMSHIDFKRWKHPMNAVGNAFRHTDKLPEALRKQIRNLIDKSIKILERDYLMCESINDIIQMKMQDEKEEFSCKKLSKQFINYSLEVLKQTHQDMNYQTEFQPGIELQIMFCFHAAHMAIPFFSKAQESFLNKVDLEKTVQKEKERVKQLFTSILKKEGKMMIGCREVARIIIKKVFELEMKNLTEFQTSESLPNMIIEKHIPRKETIHGLVLLDILDYVSEPNLSQKHADQIKLYFQDVIKLFSEKIADVIDRRNVNAIECISAKVSEHIRKIEDSLNQISTGSDDNVLKFVAGCPALKDIGIGLADFNCVYVPEDIVDISELIQVLTSVLRDTETAILAEEIKEIDAYNVNRVIINNIKDQLFECQAKCPFCLAICDHDCSTSTDLHMCHTHRPQGFGHYKGEKTKVFTTKLCTQYVASERSFRNGDSDEFMKFKDYHKLGEPYSKWKIEAGDGNTLIMWKYITYKLMPNINIFFPKVKPAEVSRWGNITLKEAQNLVRRKFFVEGAKKVDGVYII